jgi:glycoprotein endo-alpha-1,2-mannosidase
VSDKPLYYVYDSYKLAVDEWNKVLLAEGEFTVRNTSADAVFIGLWVKEEDGDFFVNSGLDGFYTYFASDGFEYGCTSTNWLGMSAFAKANDLLFVPCAGPGYIDTRIRPWNAQNIKAREEGKYYEVMFNAAAATNPDYIGITSFNEWHEGTQIEPAVGKSAGEYTYEDYGPGVDPWFYIYKTRELVESIGNLE